MPAGEAGVQCSPGTPGRGEMMIDILVVEDEPAILEALEFILARSGWAIASAGDGETALVAAREHRPRLMLLDIMLPRMSGFDVLKVLRADPALGSTPVLVLTARGQQYDRKAALDLGATEFVTKPFANDELLATVRRLLDAGGSGAAAHA